MARPIGGKEPRNGFEYDFGRHHQAASGAKTCFILRVRALNALARAADPARSHRQCKADLKCATTALEELFEISEGTRGNPNRHAPEFLWTALRLSQRYLPATAGRIIYSEWGESLDLVEDLSGIVVMALRSCAAGAEFAEMVDQTSRLANHLVQIAHFFTGETADYDPAFSRWVDVGFAQKALSIASLLFAALENGRDTE